VLKKLTLEDEFSMKWKQLFLFITKENYTSGNLVIKPTFSGRREELKLSKLGGCPFENPK